jgi:hypothetical protein
VVKDPEIKKKVQVYHKRLYDKAVGRPRADPVAVASNRPIVKSRRLTQ